MNWDPAALKLGLLHTEHIPNMLPCRVHRLSVDLLISTLDDSSDVEWRERKIDVRRAILCGWLVFKGSTMSGTVSLHLKWHPIPDILSDGPWSKVVHYIVNRVFLGHTPLVYSCTVFLIWNVNMLCCHNEWPVLLILVQDTFYAIIHYRASWR